MIFFWFLGKVAKKSIVYKQLFQRLGRCYDGNVSESVIYCLEKEYLLHQIKDIQTQFDAQWDALNNNTLAKPIE